MSWLFFLFTHDITKRSIWCILPLFFSHFKLSFVLNANILFTSLISCFHNNLCCSSEVNNNKKYVELGGWCHVIFLKGIALLFPCNINLDFIGQSCWSNMVDNKLYDVCTVMMLSVLHPLLTPWCFFLSCFCSLTNWCKPLFFLSPHSERRLNAPSSACEWITKPEINISTQLPN